MLKNSQAGFTLIEIIVVLAIASTLVAVVLSGAHAARFRTQFLGSMESIDQTIRDVKNEANTTVNVTGTGTSSGPNRQIVFGKAITFTPGSQTINVDTLLCTHLDDLSHCSVAAGSILSVDMSPGSSYTLTIPWDAAFNPALVHPQMIIFTKTDANGTLVAYAPPPDGSWNLSKPLASYDSSSAILRPASRDIEFDDVVNNLVGTVHFNAQSMTLTRTIN